MTMNPIRPGEFRICPQCASRQKGGFSHCQACGSSLQEATVAERAFVPTHTRRPLNRGLAVVLVLAVVGAATLGIALRNTLRSPAFDKAAAVEAAPATRLDTPAQAIPDASVYDRLVPVTQPAIPEAWYALSRRAPIAPPVPPPAIRDAAAPVDPAPSGGMMGIAPQTNSRIAIRAREGAVVTNDDLAQAGSPSPAISPETPVARVN